MRQDDRHVGGSSRPLQFIGNGVNGTFAPSQPFLGPKTGPVAPLKKPDYRFMALASVKL